jgi:hypothetical protein
VSLPANFNLIRTNGTLSAPLGLNVTVVGTQLCAEVESLEYSAYVPVAVKNAVDSPLNSTATISASAATAVPTKVVPSSSQPNVGLFGSLFAGLVALLAI